MKRYEVLLFDVDGTLLDFDKAEERGIEALLLRYGVPVSMENKEKYHVLNKSYWQRMERGELTRDQVLCRRFEEFFGSFHVRVDGKEVDRQYRETLDGCAFLIEGAVDLLEYLKGRYELYIITNGVASTQRRRLRDSGLDMYFNDIFISEEAGCQKPMREFFEGCFDRMGRRDVEHMLVIGDSLSSDICGGNNSGIDTCWYNPRGDINRSGARVDMELRDLAELKQILCRGAR